MFQNFVFHNPVKVIFGKGTIAQLPKEIDKSKKIMLTYGQGSIFKNGVYDQVKKALEGYDIVEFGGIEANPQYSTLMKGVEQAREAGVDFLLAVGGGSVVDGTKFMSAAIPFKGGDEWNNIVRKKANYTEVIPLAAVLTLPATGSEMNYHAVISRKETNEKFGMGHKLLFPVFSILDPEVTYTLPQKQVANGVADAFTHVMEQYLTYPVGAELQDRMAEGVLQTLIKSGPETIKNLEDYEARANMMWAATVALNGWISPGVPQDWATHQIGHELTALHGVDHARSLAVVLPYLLTFKKSDKKAKLIQYAQRVWNLTGTDDELVDQAIAKTQEFYELLGISTKAADYGINKETASTIRSRFEERGTSFGEQGDINGAAAEEILLMSLAD